MVRAACLAVDGVAAGRCAGHFWGMRRFEPKVVEIFVERAHTPRLGGVFLAVLRQFGLPEPVPQHEVGNRRLDAYPERLTGFELQALLAHAEKEDIKRNCAKANALLDWTIAYFTWDDVHGKAGHVAATVQALLRRPALAAA